MRRLFSLALATLVIVLAGCGSKEPAPSPPVPDGNLRIATATRAGVYYPVGEAMARVWTGRVPEIKPRVLLTSGGPENIQLLLRGEADVAFSQSGVVYRAVTEPERGEKVRSVLRGVTYLYPNVIHLVVRRDAGVRTPADLKGLRFVPGAEGSAAVINSTEVLSLYGLALSDVQVQYLGYAEAAQALVDGRADAALIPGGMPTEAVTTMLGSGVVELLPLDALRIMKRYPWYLPFNVAPGAYPGLDRQIRTVAVANVLMARADLPEELVYRLVRALYEGKADLRQGHPAADLDTRHALQGITGVLELHPGAARYMREAGVLP